MSKITITSIKKVEREGKTTFWSCEDSLGEKFTVWNEDIARMIGMNLNKEVNYEVKTTPTGFHNIRGISTSTEPSTQEYPTAQPTQPVKKVTSTNTSIVAQCMVKAVFGQPVSFENKSRGIDDAINMYKKAVELLEDD